MNIEELEIYFTGASTNIDLLMLNKLQKLKIETKEKNEKYTVILPIVSYIIEIEGKNNGNFSLIN